MLHPYFFRCPPELNLNLRSPRMRFQITGYGQEGDFTLVGWRFGDGEEYISGEILYQEKTMLACGGGTLNLPGDNPADTEAFNPWDRVSQQDIDISPVVSAMLRKNYFFFPSSPLF